MWPWLPFLQGIQLLVALEVAGLQRIKPLKALFAISSGNTTPHGLKLLVYKAITLKTILGVHKTYHACLFFDLSLALLSQNS